MHNYCISFWCSCQTSKGDFFTEKDVKRTILRVLKGKKGTGRKRTQKEVYSQMQRYRQITATVEPNLDWEDYLNLIDIGTKINVNNAVDLAFRIGFLAGKRGK